MFREVRGGKGIGAGAWGPAAEPVASEESLDAFELYLDQRLDVLTEKRSHAPIHSGADPVVDRPEKAYGHPWINAVGERSIGYRALREPEFALVGPQNDTAVALPEIREFRLRIDADEKDRLLVAVRQDVAVKDVAVDRDEPFSGVEDRLHRRRERHPTPQMPRRTAHVCS